MDERLQEGDVGAAIPFAFLSSGRLMDDGAPLRGNDFVSDGRKKAEEGGGDGEWALMGDRGEASSFGNKVGEVDRG